MMTWFTIKNGGILSGNPLEEKLNLYIKFWSKSVIKEGENNEETMKVLLSLLLVFLFSAVGCLRYERIKARILP
jgi:hypothetical protein